MDCRKKVLSEKWRRGKRVVTLILTCMLFLGFLHSFSLDSYALESTGYEKLDKFINDSRWTNGVSWNGSKTPNISSWSSWGCCAYCSDYVKYCYDLNSPVSGTKFTDVNEVRAGDVITLGNPNDGTGHWFVVLKRNGNSLYVAEGNYSKTVRIGWNYSISGSKFAEDSRYFNAGYHYLDSKPNPDGHLMETGYDRVLPDGDYIISTALSDSKGDIYFMDINGTANPAEAGTNVSLCRLSSGDDLTAVDVWTITYANGFYSIKQKGTDMSLDVDNASLNRAGNIKVWYSTGNVAQLFAISQNSNGYGYRIQAKCSSLSLDVNGGSCAGGVNIQQYIENDTNAQTWHFIPYKPEQPIANGRYVLLSKADKEYEIDIPGNSSAIGDKAELQVWDSSTCLSKYNSFDVKKLDNGYYSFTLACTGQVLSLKSVQSGINTATVVETADGSSAQQWAIRKVGDAYILVSRRTGMAADIHTGNAGNGNYIKQYWYHAMDNQLWYFVPAEHTVTYDLNGGKGTVGSQTKYYKESLKLSSVIPSRDGAEFLGWSTSKTATSAEYQANDTYDVEQDLSLYAVWKIKTGWVSENNKWYYYGTDGKAVTGWKQIIKKWYYFDASGIMQTGWKQISKKWYYFDASGVMQTGWKQISKKWYYFNASGVMQTGWQQISKKWYYFNNSGAMLTGWQKISGKWYFLKNGVMVTGWQQISGKWYFFSNGAMVTGTKTISGKTYQFDENGVCQNP